MVFTEKAAGLHTLWKSGLAFPLCL